MDGRPRETLTIYQDNYPTKANLAETLARLMMANIEMVKTLRDLSLINFEILTINGQLLERHITKKESFTK